MCILPCCPSWVLASSALSLTIGSRLGPYEILSLIGAGGMGEVYRARDTRLGRDVAVKVLPSDLAHDADRLVRFEREAQAVAALNHPNVVALYDVGTQDGSPFVVTELLEGETVRERLAKGALPQHTAVEIGVEIAHGLAAAHARGIVHRDLKPANIFVTSDGVVKLLDFGLAKLVRPDGAVTPSGTTMNQEMRTESGSVLGTMGYTSPEQLRGEAADARSDIFAFGCVLYEVLSGRSPFLKPTGAETITAIMSEDPPPLSGTGRAITPALREIVNRCLEKRPDDRFSTAHDLALALRVISGSGELAPVQPMRSFWRHRRLLGGSVLAVASIVIAATAVSLLRGRHDARRAGPPGGSRLRELFSTPGAVDSIALSCDGKMLAYVLEEDGKTDLYVTQVAGGVSRRLTNDEAREAAPQFSPDGDRLAFTRFSSSGEAPEICVMAALGGAVTPVLAGAIRAAWAPDGSRLACVLWQPPQPQTLAIVGADGRDLKVLAHADSVYPFFGGITWSPDGTYLAVARSAGGEASEIWTVQTSDGKLRRLWADPPGVYSSAPAFLADGSGIVHVSARGGAENLWFMPVRGGVPVQLTSGPGPDLWPSVSRNGAIAFVSVHRRAGLWAYDLEAGTKRQLTSHSKYLWAPAVSPDGLDIAYSRAEEDGSWHIWIVPTRGGEPRRLTSSSLPEVYPRFSPDGKWVIYCTWSAQADRIWRVARRGGPAEPLSPERSEDDQYADISPDGRRLAFARTEGGETHVVVQEIGRTAARQITKRTSTLPRWSPDGRWIAFGLDRSSASGIFLVTPDGTDEHRLTETGGWPVWWPDSRAVAYTVVGFDGLQRARIESLTGPLTFSPPVFPVTGQNTPFDISKDGRYLAITDGEVLGSGIWLLEPREGSASSAKPR
jgi:eukaryotic-like serine/threonine-protein kinase